MRKNSFKVIWVVYFLMLWQIFGCTLFNINVGPSIDPLKEKVILGKGQNKVLLRLAIDLSKTESKKPLSESISKMFVLYSILIFIINKFTNHHLLLLDV